MAVTKQESNYISSAARASLTRSSVWHSYIHIAVHINLYKPIHIRICVYIYTYVWLWCWRADCFARLFRASEFSSCMPIIEHSLTCLLLGEGNLNYKGLTTLIEVVSPTWTIKEVVGFGVIDDTFFNYLP